MKKTRIVISYSTKIVKELRKYLIDNHKYIFESERKVKTRFIRNIKMI